ncbi:glycine cleavage system protein GcvH [Amphibacillus sediminis]|uniref:glycine cleavage system protein GcvH n=1 Tax=Amphibacillus sediminis TaxID=360185 RepID=UPI00082BFD85|nr:glycine cleavage system protein GcvH [Amphibacillus sediminis]
MKLPEDLNYSKEHIWLKKQEDQTIKIGITDHAQDELGDIVFVELPEPGDQLALDQTFGSVESVKTVSELYAPVAGEVIEVNQSLEDEPELVNTSPFEKGWMVVIKPNRSDQIEQLLSAKEYNKMIQEV